MSDVSTLTDEGVTGLADHAIGIHLPTIPPNKRKTLGAFNRDFAKAKPIILGALLDAVSCALGRIDSVSLTEAPQNGGLRKMGVSCRTIAWMDTGGVFGLLRSKPDQKRPSCCRGQPRGAGSLVPDGRPTNLERHGNGT